MEMESIQGLVRVGTKKGTVIPSYDGFTKVICLMPSSRYGDISPYTLKDEKGRLLENVWQFSKFYLDIPKSVQRYARVGNKHNRRIIWEHGAEVHMTSEREPNSAYLAWRKKGMEHNEAVRYPATFKHRTKCICAYKEQSDGSIDVTKPLDYVKARKEIYLPLYMEAVKKSPTFLKLQARLKNGENLLIIEVDGPHEESLSYYKESYGVPDDFIERDTILATPDNMKIMLNDTKHNFGHGYCLAMALLEMDSKHII